MALTSRHGECNEEAGVTAPAPSSSFSLFWSSLPVSYKNCNGLVPSFLYSWASMIFNIFRFRFFWIRMFIPPWKQTLQDRLIIFTSFQSFFNISSLMDFICKKGFYSDPVTKEAYWLLPQRLPAATLPHKSQFSSCLYPTLGFRLRQLCFDLLPCGYYQRLRLLYVESHPLDLHVEFLTEALGPCIERRRHHL
jgi:hypothetical protein